MEANQKESKTKKIFKYEESLFKVFSHYDWQMPRDRSKQAMIDERYNDKNEGSQSI